MVGISSLDAASNFDRDKIIRAMVGRGLSDELYTCGASRAARPHGKKVLSIQNLSMSRIVRNSSFSVYAGQITGIFRPRIRSHRDV
jgi:simple sugar transport system ATP-binding protein